MLSSLLPSNRKPNTTQNKLLHPSCDHHQWSILLRIYSEGSDSCHLPKTRPRVARVGNMLSLLEDCLPLGNYATETVVMNKSIT